MEETHSVEDKNIQFEDFNNLLAFYNIITAYICYTPVLNAKYFTS